MPARIRGKSQLSIAREGFLDRRSKRCFWLLLSPQTKVARAGARNYPHRRQILRLRRCAATPHPPPSGAPSPQGEGLRVRHSRRGPPQGEGLRGYAIQHREPLKGKANGGVSFNTADPSRGRLTEACHSTPRTPRGKADGCGRGTKKDRRGRSFCVFWAMRLTALCFAAFGAWR